MSIATGLGEGRGLVEVLGADAVIFSSAPAQWPLIDFKSVQNGLRALGTAKRPGICSFRRVKIISKKLSV